MTENDRPTDSANPFEEGVEGSSADAWDMGYQAGLAAPSVYSAAYVEGFAQGRKWETRTTSAVIADIEFDKKALREEAVRDWLMYFILYMQQAGHEFAVVTLTQLQDLRDVAVRLRAIVDNTGDLDPLLEEIEDTLLKLETVAR